MEDGLVPAVQSALNGKATGSLNPYCSGRWSRTTEYQFKPFEKVRLNPYCSGRWSRTLGVWQFFTIKWIVLILIVVEDGLVHSRRNKSDNQHQVLILIVVEDGLVHRDVIVDYEHKVLILIVVEDGLVLIHSTALMAAADEMS